VGGKGNRWLGALAFVTKPFDPSAFAKLVTSALARRGALDGQFASD
jgi:hypothetical protein